jgi:hypothetical protein
MTFLKEETQYFSTKMFSSGFFMVHDTTGCRQHKESEKGTQGL